MVQLGRFRARHDEIALLLESEKAGHGLQVRCRHECLGVGLREQPQPQALQPPAPAAVDPAPAVEQNEALAELARGGVGGPRGHPRAHRRRRRSVSIRSG